MSERLKGRDITISIEVGDLFAGSDTLVIGSNRTFDTDIASSLISTASVQGQFTERYYSSVDHLDTDLDAALGGLPNEALSDRKVGKLKMYPIGTVAKLFVKKPPRKVFWVALAHLNEDGVAKGSIADLRVALASLWEYVANKGGDLPSLRMPILGTGLSKLPAKRDEVIREILGSFVAACAETRFCESLTIVIHPSDYRRFDIDLNEVEEYLRYICRFRQIRNTDEAGAGRGTAATA